MEHLDAPKAVKVMKMHTSTPCQPLATPPHHFLVNLRLDLFRSSSFVVALLLAFRVNKVYGASGWLHSGAVSVD